MKCDESKPACTRCVSTGRACDGYGFLTSGGICHIPPRYKHAATVTAALNPSILHKRPLLPGLGSITDDESDSFDFFRRHLSEKLSGAFYSNFWTMTILQLSVKEPAVFHALAALSSIQRLKLMQSQSSIDETKALHAQLLLDKWHRFGLEQYNKAIESLQIHFAVRDHLSTRIVLAVCILFTCTDILRGSLSAASAHIENARTMLVSMWATKRNFHRIAGSSCNSPFKSAESLDLDLIQTTVRMNTLNLVFGHPIRCLLSTAGHEALNPSHIPRRFIGLEDMRNHLDKIFNLILRQPEKLDENKKWSKMCLEEFELQQHTLRLALDRWLEAYNNSVADIRQTTKSTLRPALELLRVYYSVATIIAAVRGFDNLEASQMDFDNHDETFTDIIIRITKLSETYNLAVPSTRTDPYRPESSQIDLRVDMVILPPLAYTAIKCRDPFIRRSAINLLADVSYSEGVWDGAIVAAAVKKIVDIEERGFYDAVTPNTYSESLSTKHNTTESPQFHIQFANQASVALPDTYRLHDVQVYVEDCIGGNQKRIVYHCRRGQTRLHGKQNIKY